MLKLILLLLMKLSLLTANLVLKTDISLCHEIKIHKNMNCYNQESEIFIQLDNYVHLFNKYHENSVTIQCHQSRSINVDKVPNVSWLNVWKLEVTKCLIKNNSILSEIREKFDLKNVNHLILNLDAKQSAINSTLLKDFTNLKKLTITSHNKNQVFDENSFQSLKELENLVLNVYDVITLPVDLLKSLTQLKTLHIRGTASSVKKIDQTFNLTLQNCKQLETFSLENIRWPVRVNFIFYRALESIVITKNTILSLNENMFQYAGQVDSIDLSNNSLSILPEKIFWFQKQMQKIDLSQNNLSRIVEAIFKFTRELEEIDLSNNRLTFIESNALMNLPHLRKLSLNNNHLTRFSLTTLNGILDLELLYLQHNFITDIDGILPILSNLNEIDFSGNKITRFFIINFFQISTTNLTVLLESNDKLESIDFRDLESNTLKYPENHLEINLGSTPMECNCHTMNLFEFLHNKTEFYARIKKNIKIHPETIECNPTYRDSPKTVNSINPTEIVCSLDTSHSILCPTNCRCMRRPSDKLLIIECVNISEVPILPPYKHSGAIALDQIHLKVSKNGIKSLPTTSQPIYNDVTKIFASFNEIDHLDLNNIPENLIYLDLHYNRLTFIASNVLVRLKQLEVLQLSENHWNCSQAKDLVHFVKSNRKIVRDVNLIRCSNHKYFLELDSEKLSCSFQVYLSILLCAFLLALIIVGYLYHRNKHAIIEWIFSNDKYHLMEKFYDFLKPIDACVVAVQYDQVFASYIARKLMKQPEAFKCGLLIKTWNAEEEIPDKILRILRKSRRVIVILSELFDENNWRNWSYSNINARIVFITKGSIKADEIELSNKVTIRFNDPFFWDKVKHSMSHRKEMKIKLSDCNDVEMQPLRIIE